MIVELGWLLGGLFLLVAGGEGLVRGATGLALRAHLRPAVVGLTVVAAGTSMPELVVSVRAAIGGSSDLSVGNVVGSNVFNAAAILGLTALVRPLTMTGQTVRLEWPVMMLASLQVFLLARHGGLDRLEGGFLLGGLVAFTAYLVFLARRDLALEDADAAAVTSAGRGHLGAAGWARDGAAVVIGVALLALGSTALIHGATALAANLGVSERVIGVTIVAAGTSTPELVTSMVAALRGRADIAVGNVVGSNVFNLLGILGVTAVIAPLRVAPEILRQDLPWMLGTSALLFPLMWTGMRINRTEGAALLVVFGAYWGLQLAG